MSYAEKTGVSVSRSRVEIEDTLRKYKATSIGVMFDPGLARVGFKIGQWAVCFKMPLPTSQEASKKKNTRGFHLSAVQQGLWLDQEERRRWRCLLLTIKAKLVSVENQVETFEEAFLAHLVLPGGDTVAEAVLPAIRNGRHPLALPPGEPVEREIR